MIRHHFLGVALLALMGVSGCSQRKVTAIEQVQPIASNLQAAPQLSITDLQGVHWTNSSLEGRTVLVEFWASWCEPCHEIAPDLRAFYEKHQERVSLLSISLDERTEAFRRHTQEATFPGAVAYGGPSLAKTWGVTQMPALVLVRDGVMLTTWQGKMEVKQALKRLALEFKAAN